MPIPDYERILLPFLKLLNDLKEHPIRALIKNLTKEFNLTDKECGQRLPSGKGILFNSRVRWAGTHLVKAGLIERPKRGFVRITKRGLNLLQDNPLEIDKTYLKRYPEFVEFMKTKTKKRN